MAGPAIPARLVWAIDQLDVRPTDRLLEIGCGRGIAVSLICGRLTTGSITAIDRSPVAIKAAQARNRDHIAAGRATFHTLALADTNFAKSGFDKIFAVNVNVFWTDGTRALAAVRNMLAPPGVLHLVYQPPTTRQLITLTGKLAPALARSGFSVDEPLVVEGGTPLLCISGRIPMTAPDRRQT